MTRCNRYVTILVSEVHEMASHGHNERTDRTCSSFDNLFMCCSRRSPGGWRIREGRFAREACSGVDRLGYSIYAETLAGLFTTTGEENDLPAAVGVYAPWGAGKVRPRSTTTPPKNAPGPKAMKWPRSRLGAFSKIGDDVFYFEETYRVKKNRSEVCCIFLINMSPRAFVCQIGRYRASRAPASRLA